MSPEQATAKRRSILKRYLTKLRVPFSMLEETWKLQAMVEYHHRQRRKRVGRLPVAWPIDLEAWLHDGITLDGAAKHYLRQLLAIRQMGWSSLNFVGDEPGEIIKCRTVSDLIKIGVVPEKFAYLELYIEEAVASYQKKAG